MPVSQRFKEVIDFYKKSAMSLSRDIEVSHTAIGDVLKGKTLPSSKILIPLGERFNVNINWLLFGVGEMFVTPPITDTKNISGDVGLLQIGNNNKNEKINIKSNKDNTYYNVKDIESLIQQLKEKDKQIAAKDEVIRSKDEIIRSKDEIIHLLKNK
jgi:hypothetical protein